MTFNPFLQLNYNSAFTCGALIGNHLRESLTAEKREVSESVASSSSVNFNLFSNNWFSVPVMPVNRFDVSIFPQSCVQMPIVQQNWFDSSFDNIGTNLSAGWNYFSNMFIQPFNFINIVSNKRADNVKYAKFEDYNAEKGKKLANIVYDNTSKRFDVNWRCIGTKNKSAVVDHDCARHVALAIDQAGLGDCRVDSAYQMAGKLRSNPNFKELPVEGVDLDNLPPGAVCIYNQNKHGYSSQHGHVTIKTENGCAAEHYSKKLLTPDYIFIPV